MTDRNSKLIYDSGNPSMDGFRRGLLQGVALDTEVLRKRPLIAIANSHSELTTGHAHLNKLAERVKMGILAAGGEAFEFNVPAPCDGVAMGHDGMNYVLAQRDLIADIIETHVRSQKFDGLVMIAGCDKINPGMMMAAARLDMPSIYLAGGPGTFDIRNKRGEGTKPSINHSDHYDNFENLAASVTCATCGACEIMGTANTFQCLAEVMGICLPGSSNVPATDSRKLSYARRTGERVVELVREGTTFRDILTPAAMRNAVIMNMAIGGSTNAVLHLPAVAHSLGMELPLSVFDECSATTPTLLAISPNGPWGIPDLWAAGGMPAVIKTMQGDLDMSCRSVGGGTLQDVAKNARVLDSRVIPDRSEPFREDGGIAVLRGNLAPNGAVIKQAGVSTDQLSFSGKAICFNSEAEALAAIREGAVTSEHVVVIRYVGPKGAPGMPEMLGITSTLKFMGLRCAVVTDGRYSGATSGISVGHIAPEAYDRGPIAAVIDGDTIRIDIQKRELEIDLTDQVLSDRLDALDPVETPIPPGFMRRYRKHVSCASTGAVLD
ncbi:dihydroxy-acid dehydratase [Pacificimonas sp. WHA3]|uniref:Dihydroxy-acid dehydratase n=1 Tax=Pacificimonas pallii TaxID=2827236 RepID=A0ABS6SG59_9SPHN|nr:dihydroxy-acid dehydratase [Pacificimonas pallii]MBV7257380.1 dihydroxy-acid dehydratase [Pacificimonas pallii]